MTDENLLYQRLWDVLTCKWRFKDTFCCIHSNLNDIITYILLNICFFSLALVDSGSEDTDTLVGTLFQKYTVCMKEFDDKGRGK